MEVTWPTWAWNLLRRTTRAAALSCLAFYLFVMPFNRLPFGRDLGEWPYRVLDAPVSALNVLLPGSWRSPFAIQFWSQRGTYCFPAPVLVEMSRYALVGIPAWLMVLYALPLLGRRIRIGLRRQCAA